jgi:hypothetical protein
VAWKQARLLRFSAAAKNLKKELKKAKRVVDAVEAMR